MHKKNDDEIIIKDKWMSEEYAKNNLGIGDTEQKKEAKQDLDDFSGLLDGIDEEKLSHIIEENQVLEKKDEINLAKFLIDCELTSFSEGRCVWINMANRDIEVNNVPLENGSMRLLGQLISAVCGGNYMDYYCAREDKGDVDRVWKIMEEHGAKIVTNGLTLEEVEEDLKSMNGKLD
ncbi:MAG: hypothetical protein ACTSRE_16310 [Promethearchaeota archaeon]